jgi:hypothetical protein
VPKPELVEIRNSFGRLSLDSKNSVLFGIICLDEMGLSHSAAVVAGSIFLLRSRHLAMLGMC